MTKTTFDMLVGASAVALFANLWMCSIMSPFAFIAALLLRWKVVATVIALVTMAAYAPFSIHSPRLLAYIRYALPRAVDGWSITYEDNAAPPAHGTAPPRLYAVHPHGIFSLGFFSLASCAQMARARTFFCFSPFLYYSPFFRLFTRMLGYPGRADKEFMTDLMRRGQHQALIPGGFEEATLTSGDAVDRVYIKQRAGFLKYCVQHGVDVCPVYAFGEKGLWGNVQGMWKPRLALNALGLPAIVPFGLCGTILPRRRPLHVVVGAPISFSKAPNPSAADVAAAHEQYIAALVALYDRHKAAFEEQPGELEVW
jgi:hypothetical protein